MPPDELAAGGDQMAAQGWNVLTPIRKISDGEHYVALMLVAAALALSLLAAVAILYYKLRVERRAKLQAEQYVSEVMGSIQSGFFRFRKNSDQTITTELISSYTRRLARLPEQGDDADCNLLELFEFALPEERVRLKRLLQQSLENAEPFREAFRFRFPEQGEGWLLVDARCRRTDEDTWIGHVSDVSRERSLKENLNKVLVTRDDFIASAGHELRTPIQNVLMAVQSIDTDRLSAADARSLSAARTAATDLAELVDDFMEVSSANSPATLISREPFNLHDLVTTVCRSFTAISKSKGLGYEQTIDNNVPIAVVGDSLRLKQVLYNIIGNAFKYTHQGYVKVYVALEASQPDAHLISDRYPDTAGDPVYIDFSVEDTGIGIATEQVPYIFEPFATIGPLSRRSSGLGLAVCDRLCRLMNGRIQVDTSEGAGSRFIVSLPFDISPQDDETDLGALTGTRDLFDDTLSNTEPFQRSDWDGEKTSDLPFSDPFQSNRLLVVDDNFMVRDMLASLLSIEGWQVLQAASGSEALALMSKYECRAVVTDHKMPGMTGLQLGEAILHRYAHRKIRPVLAIMSGGMSVGSSLCAQELFDVVLSKPVRASEVHDALQHAARVQEED